MLNKLPYPIAGLALGFAALGNLLGSYSQELRFVLGAVALIIALAILAKIIKDPKSFKEGLNHPLISSSMATFPMAFILLAGYIRPMLPTIAFIVWCAAIVFYIGLIIVFTKNFILNFNIKKVFATYFVLYVGIVVTSLTSKAMGFPIVGIIAFWFGLLAYIALLIPVFKRLHVVKEIPDVAKPSVGIVAAPASLLLAGYLTAFDVKYPTIVIIMLIIAQLMMLYVLVQMPKFLTGPFFPAYSSFTFPFVISAIALKQSVGYFNEALGFQHSLLPILVLIETVIAVFMVLYVAVRYIKVLFIADKNS